jgi:hypothetical protein
MEHELIGAAVVAWMTAKGMEIAKQLKWLPLNTNTEVANRWAARVAAAVSTFGIHATFDPDAGTLLITGLSLTTVGGAVLEYARQYMFQEIAYKKFVRAEAARQP